MKKLLLIMFLVSNLFALSKMSSVPTDQKKLVDKIVDILQLPKKAETKIYDKLSPYLINDWSVHWTNNISLKNSKLSKSSTRVLDLFIYNNNRFSNLNFVYFKDKKQILYSQKEYLISSSNTILEKFDEFKKDSKLSLESESDNYAYFQEKGYKSYKSILVKGSAGMLIYQDYTLINID